LVRFVPNATLALPSYNSQATQFHLDEIAKVAPGHAILILDQAVLFQAWRQ
jgi:hypothetical protein